MLAATASVIRPRRCTTTLLVRRSALTVKSDFDSSSTSASPKIRSSIAVALRDRISETRGIV